jgi:hypothetical protein
MTKRISGKRLAAFAAGAALLLTNSLPAFAETTGSGTSTRQEESACERVANLSTKVQGRLDEGRQNLQARRDERDRKLAEHRTEQDSKFAARREKWEHDWNDLLGRLSANGRIDPVVIAAYKGEMEAAWQARNAAIDAAEKSFNEGVSLSATDKKTAVLNASLAFKASVTSAFAKAESECVAGGKPVKIMTEVDDRQDWRQDRGPGESPPSGIRESQD